MKKFSAPIGALLCGVSVFGLASPAAAQEAAPAAGGNLDEIIVTAQRRAENQQSVPIAITTVTATALDNAGAAGTNDLSNVVPGLVMNRQLRGSVPFLRGVGATQISKGNEQPVATYVDGVYMMNAVGNVLSFNNIERIEVLKGPQGTLFGRNATGGLMNIITRDPSTDFGASATVSYGNYDTASAQLYVTGGLTDNLAADLAVVTTQQGEGYGRNLTLRTEANYEESYAVRGKMLWTPSTTDRFTLSADYDENKSDVGVAGSIYPGSIGVGGVRHPGGPWDIIANYAPVGTTRNWGVSLKYQHEFPWGEFQSLTSYRNQAYHVNLDQDRTASLLPGTDVRVDQNAFDKWAQQELLLTGESGRLNWTTGAFLFTAWNGVDPLNVVGVRSTFGQQDTLSVALFAQGTYAVTDDTRLTLGLRETYDVRYFSGQNVSTTGVVTASARGELSTPKLTYRIGVDHDLTDNVMIYATYNRGYKSGVYSTSQITAPPANPETLDALEVGFKSELFDRTLRVNGAAFFNDYQNMQLQAIIAGQSLIYNAAKGEMKGGELEVVAAPPVPVGDFRATLGLSYLDATYASFPSGIRFVPSLTGGNIQTTANLTGFPMIRAPKWTLKAGLDYEVNVGPGILGAHVNYYYNDGFNWEPDGRLKEPSFSVVNAQVSYELGSDHKYRISVYGKNLTDEVYGSYISASALGDFAVYQPPMTYGVSFSVDY